MICSKTILYAVWLYFVFPISFRIIKFLSNAMVFEAISEDSHGNVVVKYVISTPLPDIAKEILKAETK